MLHFSQITDCSKSHLKVAGNFNPIIHLGRKRKQLMDTANNYYSYHASFFPVIALRNKF